MLVEERFRAGGRPLVQDQAHVLILEAANDKPWMLSFHMKEVLRGDLVKLENGAMMPPSRGVLMREASWLGEY